MRSQRRHRPEFGFPDESTQMIGLALFIILLAFFIMLSGMSGLSSERSEVAMDSVRTAFGIPSVVYFGGEGRAVNPGPMVRMGAGTTAPTLDDVAKAFEHEVPGLRAALVRRTGVLQIDIPISEMNGLFGGASRAAMQTLVRFITDTSRTPYEVTLVAHYRAGMPIETRPMTTEQFLPYWADILIDMGVPAERIRMGLRQGPPGTVGIIVTPSATESFGKSGAS